MTDTQAKTGPAKRRDSREDRLKAALKANLARRKAQARVRITSKDKPQGDDRQD